jgi:Protein of unknown function (DUF1566)
MDRNSNSKFRRLRLITATSVLSYLLMACGGGTTTVTRTGAGTSAAAITSFTPTTAQAGVATQFTVVGTGISLTSVVDLSGGTCASPTNVTALGFLVTCTPGTTLGAVTAIVNNNTPANGGFWIGQQTLTITAASLGVGLLTDTGITVNQCYGAGSDALISCTSEAAIALNAQQDGMVGRDVVNPDSSDGLLGSSYSYVTTTVTTVTATATSTTTTINNNCVKDNVTGLTWQRDSTALIQTGGFAQGAEALGYVTAANTSALCGFTDWRLPTVPELQSLVNYGLSSASPAIDISWFPATQSSWYTTGDLYRLGQSSNRWMVDFAKGRANGTAPEQLRLVR